MDNITKIAEGILVPKKKRTVRPSLEDVLWKKIAEEREEDVNEIFDGDIVDYL